MQNERQMNFKSSYLFGITYQTEHVDAVSAFFSYLSLLIAAWQVLLLFSIIVTLRLSTLLARIVPCSLL